MRWARQIILSRQKALKRSLVGAKALIAKADALTTSAAGTSGQWLSGPQLKIDVTVAETL